MSSPQPAPRPASVPAADNFQETLPEYLRPRRSIRQLVPYVVVMLLAAVWVVLLFMDSPFTSTGTTDGDQFAQTPTALNQPATGEVPAPPPFDANAPLDPAFLPEEVALPEQDEPLDLPDDSEVAMLNRPDRAGGNFPAPADEPEDPLVPVPVPVPARPLPELPGATPVNPPLEAPATAEVPVRTIPSTTPPVPATGNTPADNTAPGSTPPAPERSVAVVTVPRTDPAQPGVDPAVAPRRSTPLLYTSTEGALLHFDPEQQGWYLLPRRAFIHANEKLAVPEPFDAALELDKGRVLTTILGGTVVKSLYPEPGALFHLDVQRGRILVNSRDVGPSGEGVSRVQFTVNGQTWFVDLMAPETLIGVEAVLPEPHRFEQDLSDAPVATMLYVGSGSIRVTDPAGKEQSLTGPAGRLLSRVVLPADAEAEPAPAAAEVAANVKLPKWLAPQTITAVARQYARLFEKEFDFNERVETSISAIVSDRRPELSRLAVECLGLIGAYGPLVNHLQGVEHEESRKAAIVALRLWLPRAPEHREALRAELTKRFTPMDAEAVYRLLWGFTVEDAHNRIVSQQLVDWMGNQEIAIRELAFFHVLRLTDKKYDYRPNSSPQQLQSALNRWQQHVNKDGALLPAKPAVPSTAVPSATE